MGFHKTHWANLDTRQPRVSCDRGCRHGTTPEYPFTGHSPVRCIIEQARKDRLWILIRDGLLVIVALTKIDEVVLTNAAKRKRGGSASDGRTSTADQVWIDDPRLPTPRKATSERDHA